MSKWVWFRRNWWIINIVWGTALVLGLWIANGTLQGDAPPLFLVLFGMLFLSFGLNGISSGQIWSAPTMYRGKRPLQYWLLIIMVFILGCTLFTVGIHHLWQGS